MSRRLGLMIGILTTAVFLFLGVTMLGEGSGRLGAVLLALGVFRGGWVFRQWQQDREAEGQDTPPPAG